MLAVGDRVMVDTGAGGLREGTVVRVQMRRNGIYYGVSYSVHMPVLYVTAKRLRVQA